MTEFTWQDKVVEKIKSAHQLIEPNHFFPFPVLCGFNRFVEIRTVDGKDEIPTRPGAIHWDGNEKFAETIKSIVMGDLS